MEWSLNKIQGFEVDQLQVDKNEMREMRLGCRGVGERRDVEMTGNPSNITIFKHHSLFNNILQMHFIGNGPFQIVNSDHSKSQTSSKGHQWPKQELIKYAVYLSFHLNQLHSLSESSNLFWPFFRKLSIFLQTKNPNQCRIFHKKMMTGHSSIESLITELKSTIHKFQEWEQYYQPSLTNVQACLNRQRDEAQKQLTAKLQKNKLNISQTYKQPQELKCEAKEVIFVHQKVKLDFGQESNYIKKHEDQIPTDISYKEQKSSTIPETNTIATKETRKSFESSLIQSNQIQEDFSIFNRKPRSQAFVNVPNPQFVSNNMAFLCNNSLVSYMNQLHNFMGNSQDK